MIVYDVVETIQPGALTSNPVGTWLISTHDSEQKANELAAKYNLCRLNEHRMNNRVHYTVEAHQEWSKDRKQSR